MALTRPRASQIYNLDYKQATRVVTVDNINLAGGAPNQVDGVNLSTNDRILVTGQSTASENGLYDVETVGSGANGTWIRTGDANSTGEIDAGMIVMVTEGLIYEDTQWKLITDNPITIGVTALTFTQNYSANSISSGTSNVTVYSNANVTISSAGTPNVLVITSTGTITTGTVSATGNIIGGNIITGDISGTGNITGGNIITVGASGDISGTGNITGNYIFGNGSQLTGIDATSIQNGTSNVKVLANSNVTIGISGTSNIAVFSTVGLEITGNMYSGNLATGGQIDATGNINGNNIYSTDVISAVGTVAGGNLYTPGNALVTGNIAGGNIYTPNQIEATGNITAGNLETGGSVNVAGNINAGNLALSASINAVGNITGDYILGNGSQLSGIDTTLIQNGTSNVSVTSEDGDVAISASGTSNVAVFSTGSLTLQGAIGTPKTITSNVAIAGNVNAMLLGPMTFADGVGMTVPTSSTVYIYAP